MLDYLEVVLFSKNICDLFRERFEAEREKVFGLAGE